MPTSHQAALIRFHCLCFLHSWPKFPVRVDSGETRQPLRQGYPPVPDTNKIQQLGPLLLADGAALDENLESLQLARTNEMEPKIQFL